MPHETGEMNNSTDQAQLCADFPPHWVCKMSRSKGRKYYYNTITGESTWRLPKQEDSAKATPTRKGRRKRKRLKTKTGATCVKKDVVCEVEKEIITLSDNEEAPLSRCPDVSGTVLSEDSKNIAAASSKTMVSKKRSSFKSTKPNLKLNPVSCDTRSSSSNNPPNATRTILTAKRRDARPTSQSLFPTADAQSCAESKSPCNLSSKPQSHLSDVVSTNPQISSSLPQTSLSALPYESEESNIQTHQKPQKDQALKSLSNDSTYVPIHKKPTPHPTSSAKHIVKARSKLDSKEKQKLACKDNSHKSSISLCTENRVIGRQGLSTASVHPSNPGPSAGSAHPLKSNLSSSTGHTELITSVLSSESESTLKRPRFEDRTKPQLCAGVSDSQTVTPLHVCKHSSTGVSDSQTVTPLHVCKNSSAGVLDSQTVTPLHVCKHSSAGVLDSQTVTPLHVCKHSSAGVLDSQTVTPLHVCKHSSEIEKSQFSQTSHESHSPHTAHPGSRSNLIPGNHQDECDRTNISKRPTKSEINTGSVTWERGTISLPDFSFTDTLANSNCTKEEFNKDTNNGHQNKKGITFIFIDDDDDGSHDPDCYIDLVTTVEVVNRKIEDMDVDEEEEGIRESSHSFVIVVDTNILIHSLLFLQKLLSCSIPGIGETTLVLPWVVVQELDYLKDSKKYYNTSNNPGVARQAMTAVRFIHKHLTAKNPHMKGQTPLEANEESNLPIENNDDKILHCCLQYQHKFAKSRLCLLTRDVNLRNKATIMSIETADDETLWQVLAIPDPLVNIHTRVREKKDKTPSNKHVADTVQKATTTDTHLAAHQEKSQSKHQTTDQSTHKGKPQASNQTTHQAALQGKLQARDSGIHGATNQGKPLASHQARQQVTHQSTTSNVLNTRKISVSPNEGGEFTKDSKRDKPATTSLPESGQHEPEIICVDDYHQSEAKDIICIDLSPHKQGQSTSESNKKNAIRQTQENTENDRTAVMSKFEDVWRYIFEMRHKLGEVLGQGTGQPHYAEAIHHLQMMCPMLAELYTTFKKCLSLSPYLLSDSRAEFVLLCIMLNKFQKQLDVTTSGSKVADVEEHQVRTHFKTVRNRPLLQAGLDQLASYVSDYQAMVSVYGQK